MASLLVADDENDAADDREDHQDRDKQDGPPLELDPLDNGATGTRPKRSERPLLERDRDKRTHLRPQRFTQAVPALARLPHVGLHIAVELARMHRELPLVVTKGRTNQQERDQSLNPLSHQAPTKWMMVSPTVPQNASHATAGQYRFTVSPGPSARLARS